MTYAVIKVTSYVGMSIGAIHYYGSVISADRSKKFELSYTIEKKHHNLMNKFCDPRDWDKLDWPIGEKSIRFFEKEDVIEAGIQCFNEKFDPTVDVLLQWYPTYIWDCKEDRAIAGNPEFVEYINSATDNTAIDKFIRKLGG